MKRLRATHLALLAVCAVPTLLSVRTLYQTDSDTQLLQIGRLIADDEPVSAQMAASVRGDIQSLVTSGLCRSDLLAAALRATLKDLDFQNSYSNYDAWSQQMMSADHFITHALSCRPADGDLWVRLAMVRWSIGETPEEQATLMRRSHQYAPAEQNIIRARLVEWSRLSMASLDLLKTEFARDIQVMLLKFPTKEIVSIVNAGSNRFKREVNEASIILPQNRLVKFTKAGAVFSERRFNEKN